MLRRRPTELSPLALITVLFGAAGAALTPVHLWYGDAGHRFLADPVVVAGLLYVVLVPGVLATLWWNRGVHEIGASRATIFTYLVPLFAAGLAMGFLGERLEPYHFAGGVLIVLGLILAARAARVVKSAA
jgi:drug/metabolite transporter (DMT)-like permease